MISPMYACSYAIWRYLLYVGESDWRMGGVYIRIMACLLVWNHVVILTNVEYYVDSWSESSQTFGG